MDHFSVNIIEISYDRRDYVGSCVVFGNVESDGKSFTHVVVGKRDEIVADTDKLFV